MLQMRKLRPERGRDLPAHQWPWCVIVCGPGRREVPWRGTCEHLRQAGRSGCRWLHPEPEGDPLRAMGLGSYCFLYKQPSPAPGPTPTVRPLLGRLA